MPYRVYIGMIFPHSLTSPAPHPKPYEIGLIFPYCLVTTCKSQHGSGDLGTPKSLQAGNSVAGTGFRAFRV